MNWSEVQSESGEKHRAGAAGARNVSRSTPRKVKQKARQTAVACLTDQTASGSAALGRYGQGVVEPMQISVDAVIAAEILLRKRP